MWWSSLHHGSGRGRIPHGATKSPSPNDVEKIITLADQRDPRLATLIFLTALTGMRRGELCGLRWSDVDLPERTLLVSRSVVSVPTATVETVRRGLDHGLFVLAATDSL
jgi:integrase